MRKTLGLTCARIGELNTRLECPRQYFQERQTTVLRILQRLEGKRNRALVIRRNIELLAIHQRNATKISHLREPTLNGIHKGDNAFLAYTRAGKYRYKYAINQRFIEQTLKLFLSDLATVKIAHHELIVGFNHQLGQSGARIGCSGSIFLGYIFYYRLPVYQVASFLVHNVNHATKRLAGTHGDCYGTQFVAKALTQELHGRIVIRIRAIKTVDKNSTCKGKILGRIPEPRSNGTGATCRVNDKDGSLAGTHRSVCITDKIRIARCIQYVDARIFPSHGRNGSGNGKSSFGFLGIVIKRGLGACVATQTGRGTRQVQHCLRKHGLAHATLAHQNHILNALNTFFGHDASSNCGSSREGRVLYQRANLPAHHRTRKPLAFLP